jgi:putative cell wall-binding protein/GH25 family lysozyme M1 (1,4-beta-N-acetylmuramidase)
MNSKSYGKSQDMLFRRRPVFALVLSAVLAFGLIPATALAAPNRAGAEIAVQRLEGPTRYDTMAAVNAQGFSTTATNTVILATGENFPDALAAAGLAGISTAPVVLTAPNALSDQARQTIIQLDPATIYLLGDGNAISGDVEQQLQSEFSGRQIKRVCGANRYDTALALYQEGGSSWGKTAIVACGEKFPDALSVSPFSYATRSPIFLASTGPGLSASTAEAIRGGGFTKVLLLGGSDSVPEVVEQQLFGMNLERLFGASRYQTSVKIAEYIVTNLADTFSYSDPVISTGQKPFDALCGGVFAGKTGNVLLLADDNDPGRYALTDCLALHRSSVGAAFILGSSATLSDSLVEEIRTFSPKVWADGYYSFASALDLETPLVLSIPNSATEDRVQLQLGNSNDSSAQRFRLLAVDGGYNLIAMVSGKAWDIPLSNAYSGAIVQQYRPNSTTAQAFRLEYAYGGYVRFVSLLADRAFAISVDADAPTSASGQVAAGAAIVLADKVIDDSPQARAQLFKPTKIDRPVGYGNYQRLNGIDVSSWQPANIGDLVDYDFMIAKSTQGTWYSNPNFHQQANSALWRGKKLGIYHYADGGTDPQAEASYFVNHIQGYIGNAILILDYEGEALDNGREWVRSFMREVKRLTGVTCGLYCSSYYIRAQNLNGLCREEGALLWNANYRYNYEPFYAYDQNITPGVECEIYQYTSSGRLPGYDKNLDLNVFYGTPADWDWYATH